MKSIALSVRLHRTQLLHVAHVLVLLIQYVTRLLPLLVASQAPLTRAVYDLDSRVTSTAPSFVITQCCCMTMHLLVALTTSLSDS